MDYLGHLIDYGNREMLTHPRVDCNCVSVREIPQKHVQRFWHALSFLLPPRIPLSFVAAVIARERVSKVECVSMPEAGRSPDSELA